jgi:hypothetical protein
MVPVWIDSPAIELRVDAAKRRHGLRLNVLSRSDFNEQSESLLPSRCIRVEETAIGRAPQIGSHSVQGKRQDVPTDDAEEIMKKTRRDLLKSVGALGSVALSGGSVAASEADSQRPSQTAGSPAALQCVVTGQKKSGKSVIVNHAPMQPITAALMPGYEFYRIWGEDSRPALPSDGSPRIEPHWFPKKDGFRFAMFTVPPASSIRTTPPTAAELEEVRQKLPGMLEVLEPDHPGMHTTDSVDFDVVVFGEVVLELDDGAEAVLKAGDCVVQNGTRHAWHNRSAEKCVIASCLVGAERTMTHLRQ